MTNLPSWLSAPDPDKKRAPLITRELLLVEYENMFEAFVEKVCRGESLRELVEEDPRCVSYEHFMRWVRKDPVRHERYKECQSIYTEILASDIVRISDGLDKKTGELTMEDINRSKLQVETRKWLMTVWNRPRYGEVKQIELGGTISITQALADAQSRVMLDAEFEEMDAKT